MIDQVTEQLAKIQLKGMIPIASWCNFMTRVYKKKDEDVATYIAGIVEDESMDDEEKREVIAEFLSETTVTTWSCVVWYMSWFKLGWKHG